MCDAPGMAKNTYGTGCFMLMNTGDKPVKSKNNLLTTVAWKINGKTTYALEGSVAISGALVQWMRDNLGIIQKSSDIEPLARTVKDNGGVYFVPHAMRANDYLIVSEQIVNRHAAVATHRRVAVQSLRQRPAFARERGEHLLCAGDLLVQCRGQARAHLVHRAQPISSRSNRIMLSATD